MALKKVQGGTSLLTSSSALNDDDDEDNIDGEDDKFGMETGGWCCFMNSLPIIYLRMWLNEKPNLTSFVSRQIPTDVQPDSGVAEGSKKKRKASESASVTNNKGNKLKKSPTEAMAEAISGLVRMKEMELANRSTATDVLGVDLKRIMELQSTKEKIELLEKRISVVTRKLEQSRSDEHRQRFQAALEKLEEDLDSLVIPN